MKEWTCIVVGGGFAGIHAVKAIHKAYGSLERRPGQLRLILLDPQPYHLRKVLLFRPAAGGGSIDVPWQQILPQEVQVLQGTAKRVESGGKRLVYADAEGREQQIGYDALVVAIGSVAREPQPEQGGIALSGVDAAARIRERWRQQLQVAATQTNEAEKRRLLTVAVAGAGITGIESAAELAYAMREEAAALGLDPEAVRVHLLNGQERLFQEGPVKVSRKLEATLAECGVTVHHKQKALREVEGALLLSDGTALPVGLTVWTLGAVPNPALRGMELPLTQDGRVVVDESYRVRQAPGVYAIGDCAHIVDPDNGKADGMTCKEAVPQAQRLGKVICADLAGDPAPRHKSVMDSFTIGLGPGRGLMWAHKWGLDIIITGKLAYKIKLFLWEYASLLRG